MSMLALRSEIVMVVCPKSFARAGQTGSKSFKLSSGRILELKGVEDISMNMVKNMILELHLPSPGKRFVKFEYQVLCLVAMEKPVSLKPEYIRDEKVKVLQSVLPISLDEVVLGQYEGYKDDPTVSDSSNTPTFATVVMRIHNERWEGVPFILKAGKALNSKKAEIRVQFKDVPGDIFKCKKQGRNEFVIRLQPSEAMYMKLTVKKPGLEMSTIQSELDLSYGMRYQGVPIPEAYERLILDTIRGDQQHFVRRDELRAAWEIFTPLLHRIDDGELKPLPYKPGSRGPEKADELLAKAGYVQTHGYIWIPPTL
ncbi:uncharacterized protein A4U43_C02F9670 [Asparagus officinalis]|uniref:glucose-6-phosphate dehydrogenase (NADP(+)) n=1 Tax=Asparagus officinalis TaxID=4686 RepID=A0A5P1FHC0_ASPOF|nr:uncharacterized protein A4U43_C02F9670 [Asparagus officinalis]